MSHTTSGMRTGHTAGGHRTGHTTGGFRLGHMTSGGRSGHVGPGGLSGHMGPGGRSGHTMNGNRHRGHMLTGGRTVFGGIVLTLLLLLIVPFSSTSAKPPAKIAAATFSTVRIERTVYISRTGEMYHRGDCRYLSRSKIAIKLSEAKRQGYEACKVCRP